MHTVDLQSVEFVFHIPGITPEHLLGTVLRRDGEMVLDINCYRRPSYLIRGKVTGGHSFEGVNEGQGGVSVRAKWTLFDNRYVGFWIEEGREWVFVFEA